MILCWPCSATYILLMQLRYAAQRPGRLALTSSFLPPLLCMPSQHCYGCVEIGIPHKALDLHTHTRISVTLTMRGIDLLEIDSICLLLVANTKAMGK